MALFWRIDAILRTIMNKIERVKGMDTGYVRILTVEQAAERLQVSTKTIYEWLRTGKIPGRKIGKVWRMSEEAIVDLLRGTPGQTTAPVAQAVRKNGKRGAKTTARRVVTTSIR